MGNSVDVFAQYLESPELKGEFELIEVKEETIFLSVFLSGILIIVIVSIFRILGKKTLKGILLNEHGLPTLSKFQFLLWTLVISFSFLFIQILKIISTDYVSGQEFLINEIPENLLAMMGISVAVPIAASRLTSKMKNAQKNNTVISFGSMFCNYEGNLDLSRLQMFLWTVIGISIYLHILFDQIITLTSASDLFLPDVSPTLVILMGLSQGAYLGSKATSKTTQDKDSANMGTTNADNKENN